MTTQDKSASKAAPITIKKYANRRLYNTATSSYVTLDHLAQMVKEGTEFTVFDAKSGDDITRAVLTQIIVEEEAKGQNLLPISFLRQLISLYGDSLQALVPSYLEQTMQSFAQNQERMREYMQSTFDGLFPFAQFEEMGKQNMALFESAMNMFAPEAGNGEGKGAKNGDGKGPISASAEGAADELEDLRAKINEMQAQLDRLSANNRRSG